MTVIRLDNVAGLHIEQVRLAEDTKNGYFVQLGALVQGEKELHVGTKVVDNTKGKIVILTTPEVDPDPRKAGLKHFEVKAGDEARGHRLISGDVITLTVDLFASLPTIGDEVAPQNGSFLLDTATGDESLILEVIDETTLGYDAVQAFGLKVVKAL